MKEVRQSSIDRDRKRNSCWLSKKIASKQSNLRQNSNYLRSQYTAIGMNVLVQNNNDLSRESFAKRWRE
jgi:hypothetical protein